MKISALAGFAVQGEDGKLLPCDLTQRRVLEALVLENGTARSAEEIRRRAEIADALTVGQSLSRLRSAWSPLIGALVRDVFPEARGARGYRLQLPRSDVDVWQVDDLQRSIRDNLTGIVVDWSDLAKRIDEAESIWDASERNRQDHPGDVHRHLTGLGHRVNVLASARFENRKRWAACTARTGKRPDLVDGRLGTWLQEPEGPIRADVQAWRLWIEVRSALSSASAADIHEITDLAVQSGIERKDLEATQGAALAQIESRSKRAPHATADSKRPLSAPVPSLLDRSPNEADGLGPRGWEHAHSLGVNARLRFVGRSTEHDLMARAVVQALHDRTSHLITVTGEPGVGKSRLVAEVAATVDSALGTTIDSGRNAQWLVGRCLPEHQEATSSAFGAVVKSLAGIQHFDSPETAIAKLEDRLSATGMTPLELREIVPYLSPLIGGSRAERASDNSLFDAWSRALSALGRQNSVVLVFEDLQWADDLLLRFLDHLTEVGSAGALVVIATGRPEFLDRFSGWGGGGRSGSNIRLQRLTQQSTEDLIENFQAENHIQFDPGTRDLIVERSGGNPLFAEELARMTAADLGDGSPAGLPRLIELVIETRLGHLSNNAMLVAASAANLGRRFTVEVADAVLDLSEAEVREALNELVRLDLVHRTWSPTVPGQSEYTFWHAIVQEVAAARLPVADTPVVHLRFARWLRSNVPSRLIDVSEQLARHYGLVIDHFSPSKLPDDIRTEAIEAFQLAGHRVFPYDRVRASEHFDLAISIMSSDDPRRATLLADLVDCYTDILSTPRCEKLCVEILDEWPDHYDAYSKARIQTTLAITISSKGDIRTCISILEAAMPGLRTGPEARYMDRRMLMTYLAYAIGDTDRALESIAEMWQWTKSAVASRQSTNVMMATAQALLVDPVEPVDWFNRELASSESPLRHVMHIPQNVAQIESAVFGPRPALERIETTMTLYADREGALSGWLRTSHIEYLLLLGELTRATESATLAVAESRTISPMLLSQYIGHAVFCGLLTGVPVDNALVAEMEQLVDDRVGINEMRLVAIRSSVLHNFANANVERARASLALATQIFESKADRSTPVYAVVRLNIFRVALQMGDLDTALRIRATSDPLTDSHRAEQLAVDGYLAWQSGSFDRAAVALESAAEMFDAQGIALEAWWVRRHRAECLRLAGNSELADELQRIALARLEAFGAFGVVASAWGHMT